MMGKFLIRIITIDSCMCAPIPGLDVMYSQFRGSSINAVPVLRVFGSTATCEKICVHVHGVFPYLYVPFDGSQDAGALMHQIAASIDKAVNISLNQASSTNQHVYKISLVSGIPMYGYHTKRHQFLKIFLYNPLLIRKVSALLLNDSTLGRIYQPHESHLNFTLQFMIDYNLHGMNNMILSELKYRFHEDISTDFVEPDLFLPPTIEKTTVCKLEADAYAEHIVNRKEIALGDIAVNPGLTAIWADEMQRRRNKGETSQIGSYLELKRNNLPPTESHLLFKQMLMEKLTVWTSTNNVDNLSETVYPAETPDDMDIQNASLAHFEVPSLDLSLNNTLQNSLDDLDKTLVTSQSTCHDISMNAEALNLLDILNELDKRDDEKLEDDCILSQFAKEDEEDEFDLTLPLEPTTPTKINVNEQITDSESDEEHNRTIIPQVDGTYSNSDESDSERWQNGCCVINNPVKRKSPRTELQDVIYEERATSILDKQDFVNQRQRNKYNPNIMESYDGLRNFSSSSSEDDKTNVETTDSHHYSALPVSIKSQEKSRKSISNVNWQRWSTCSKESNRISEYSPKNRVEVLREDDVKRKLDFGSTFSDTIIEEKMICKYSSSKRGNHNLFHLEYPELTKDIVQDISADISNSSGNMTVAERYDRDNDYKSKEGCSTTLTPQVDVCEGCAEVDSKLDTSSDYSRIDIKKDASLLSEGSGNELLIQNHCCDIQQNVIDNNYTEKEVYSTVKSEVIMGCNEINNMNDNISSQYSTWNAQISKLKTKETIIESNYLSSSSDNSSMSVLTPFQNKNVSSSSDKKNKNNLISLNNEKTYCNAPSKEQVFHSLDQFNIPYLRQAKPYYSNVKDVTGNVEIGQMVLRINSKTTVHLQEFGSFNDALNNYRVSMIDLVKSDGNTKKTNWNSLLLTKCHPNNCLIMPLTNPPSLEKVKRWMNKKSVEPVSKVLSPEESSDKFKIHIPHSLGNLDEDMELSVTLSSCTSNTNENLNEILIPNISHVTNDEYKIKLKEVNNMISNQVNSSGDQKDSDNSCQITGVSINDTFGFNHSAEDLKEARAVIEHQNLTVLIMELHIRTRGELKPDPAFDSICAIFYSILNDVSEGSPECKGIIALDTLPINPASTQPILNGLGVDCDIVYEKTEQNLFMEFLKVIYQWDPDIIAGYEIELLSWGYLIERSYVIGVNIKALLGRSKINTMNFKDDDSSHELKIVGRIVLDVWRLLRHEVALQSYTFESVVYHILHKRLPYYSFKDLTFWWDYRSNFYRHRTAMFYLNRVCLILELFNKLDFIGRTSELARLFGIQFYEVLSRGSQFRVESMMLRLAKPLNFVPVSPSVQQRASMKAPEYIPLILEPESKLYNDPIIVLDFQSLYPSIIIAYNYCFTTCIGRIENLGKNIPFEFGATQLKVPRQLLEKLMKRDLLNFTPCGVAFVKQKVRDGVMPRMLREILDTRLMVKHAMKENKDDKVLQKVLHNRQLGLKLIANVTYGYTAANFSGRMPSVEVGDSVVSKGRETLHRAIEMVENTPEWGAKVVYGDTDSLFVMVPGKSREHAFKIGKKISEAVTMANPDPIKLKLEKVYQPSILQTKKRYVGYMYESPDQKEPIFEAKGIETVRRDGCPAVSKMLEKCLRILFETQNVSLVKQYVLRQFSKILIGRASIQDLTFAKEYRGTSGYRPGACVPALELTKKWISVDKRNEPRSGQRVPYVIISGSPGLPLIKLVRSPRDLLNDPSLRPNALYYITRAIIPPINRCFNLIGADLLMWFNQMPRKNIQYLPSSISPERKSTISQYFLNTNCVSCGEQTQSGICQECSKAPHSTTIILIEKLRIWETNHRKCLQICQACTSSLMEITCISLDCPVIYRRNQVICDLQQAAYIQQLLTSSEFCF